MIVPTAPGTASVPAWSLAVEGLAAPLVLPAVAVKNAAEIAPDHIGTSSSWLLSRDGSTLRVNLLVPYCTTNYQRHLLETNAVIVVWATAAPNDVLCTAPEMAIMTFALRAPSVTDR